MYNTEKDFGKTVMTKLKKEGMSCERIESHNTGLGFPDLFVQGRGFDCWLELKNCKTASIMQDKLRIDWRPGQQAWYERYYAAHRGERNVVTLMSCHDGVVVVPNCMLYAGNYVEQPFYLNWKEFKKYSLHRLLYIATHTFDHTHNTNREALLYMVGRCYPSGLDWDPAIVYGPAVDDAYDKWEFNKQKFPAYVELEEHRLSQPTT